MKEGSDPIRDLIAESGLDATEYADVAEVLATLKSSVPAEAPAPSRELAVLLASGVVTQLRPRRNTAVVATGVTAALVLFGGVAAANNSLPDPLQRFAHDVSHKVLPFEFPDPEQRAQGRGGPVQLPEQAKNDTDQGKHVGRGEGGGKTGNLGQDEDKAPDDAGKPTEPPARPPTPTPPPKPTPPTPPDRGAQGGDERPGNGDQGDDSQGDQSGSTDQGGSKPADPGNGDNSGDKGKSAGQGRSQG